MRGPVIDHRTTDRNPAVVVAALVGIALALGAVVAFLT